MNESLLEAFRHSAWATRTLVASLRALTPEQRSRPARGFGSLIATLRHVVLSDAGYVAILTGSRPAWAADDNDSVDLDEIGRWIDETEQAWERLLAAPLDADRVLRLDEGAYECPASVVIAQALQHASAHREQVRAGLGELGVRPPDLQPWAYADATGRSRWRRPPG